MVDDPAQTLSPKAPNGRQCRLIPGATDCNLTKLTDLAGLIPKFNRHAFSFYLQSGHRIIPLSFS